MSPKDEGSYVAHLHDVDGDGGVVSGSVVMRVCERDVMGLK
jgi:hypothetical protein